MGDYKHFSIVTCNCKILTQGPQGLQLNIFHCSAFVTALQQNWQGRATGEFKHCSQASLVVMSKHPKCFAIRAQFWSGAAALVQRMGFLGISQILGL